MAAADLSAERLRELLDYNPETGEFKAKTGPKKGNVVGFLVPPKNYRRVFLDGKQYYAHRLAWLYVTGEWPHDQIDHINGVKTDNRWCNLRHVSAEKNQQNWREAMPWNKTSGLLGVCWHGKNQKWVAQISVKGRSRVVGYSDDPNEAHQMYLDAKRKLHEGCTI